MPTRLCSTPRCPDPATYRGRCPTHSRDRERKTHKNKTIYNSKRWQVLRRSVLFNHPLCVGLNGVECGRIAEIVDHIVAIEDGGNPWSRQNLQSLCASCHSIKTNAEMRAR